MMKNEGFLSFNLPMSGPDHHVIFGKRLKVMGGYTLWEVLVKLASKPRACLLRISRSSVKLHCRRLCFLDMDGVDGFCCSFYFVFFGKPHGLFLLAS